MNWFVSVLIDGQYVEDLVVYLECNEIDMHNHISSFLWNLYGSVCGFCRENAENSLGVNAYWSF